MTESTTPKRTELHTVTPHLVVKNAAKAIEFYKNAFGAESICTMPMPDGRIMHASLKLGDSVIMLADEFPEAGCEGSKSPETLKGTTCTIHLNVPDVDKSIERAVKAGATLRMPAQDMFWGDRYGQIADPFGQVWSIATRKEDLTPEQMQQRGAEFVKQMACAPAK